MRFLNLLLRFGRDYLIRPMVRLVRRIPCIFVDCERQFVLIRHADYDVGATDLNGAGRHRAGQLAHVLGHVRLSHILVTDAVRTQQTAAPAAAAAGLTPQVIPEGPDNVTATVREARRHGSTVMIVGHATTVPAMIEELTGLPDPPRFGGDEFDNLFIVYRRRLQHLHYGARTPSPTDP